MRSTIILILLFLGQQFAIAQSTTDSLTMDTLPYFQIEEPQADYSAATVVARMIDGLGFRYRWATEGLTEVDLSYKPDSTSRTSLETLEHLLGLSEFILSTLNQQPIVRSNEEVNYTWEEIRSLTLNNIKTAADILWNTPSADLDIYPIVFQRGDNTSEYPFWNLLNGPIADAMWHCGQVVSYRRSSGNPIDPRVSVFRGAIRE